MNNSQLLKKAAILDAEGRFEKADKITDLLIKSASGNALGRERKRRILKPANEVSHISEEDFVDPNSEDVTHFAEYGDPDADSPMEQAFEEQDMQYLTQEEKLRASRHDDGINFYPGSHQNRGLYNTVRGSGARTKQVDNIFAVKDNFITPYAR